MLLEIQLIPSSIFHVLRIFIFSQETLRTALAMGADKAIHVLVEPSEYSNMQPIHVSKLLAKIASDEKIDLVIVGKQVYQCLLSNLLKRHL